MRKEKIKRLLPECLIALVISVAAFAFVPGIVNAALGKEAETLIPALLGLLVCGVVVVALAAALRHRENRSRGENYGKSLLRVLCMILLYVAVSLVVSVLSGLVAVLVYNALCEVLTLDQIKGIIDLLVAALVILSIPVMISLFWEQINSRESFSAAVKACLRRCGKSYLTILVCMMLWAGAGWLILTAFHYLPEGGFATVAKILIFGAAGAVALLTSENACKKGVYHR